MIQTTPRVRRVPPNKDTLSTLPSKLQQKWDKKAEKNYQHVYDVYVKISRRCLLWRHVIKNSKDKKKRKDAKKRFLQFYPTMMALHFIGFDYILPCKTVDVLDILYHRLNTH